MADFSLILAAGGVDIAIENDDIAVDGGIETAVLISVFSDARVSAELVPDGGDDPRGYWGDAIPGLDDGSRTGSELWLYARDSTATWSSDKRKEAIEKSLAWLIEDGVAQSVEAAAELVGNVERLTITITKLQEDSVTYKFATVWPPTTTGNYDGFVELVTEDEKIILTEAGYRLIL